MHFISRLCKIYGTIESQLENNKEKTMILQKPTQDPNLFGFVRKKISTPFVVSHLGVNFNKKLDREFKQLIQQYALNINEDDQIYHLCLNDEMNIYEIRKSGSHYSFIINANSNSVIRDNKKLLELFKELIGWNNNPKNNRDLSDSYRILNVLLSCIHNDTLLFKFLKRQIYRNLNNDDKSFYLYQIFFNLDGRNLYENVAKYEQFIHNEYNVLVQHNINPSMVTNMLSSDFGKGVTFHLVQCGSITTLILCITTQQLQILDNNRLLKLLNDIDEYNKTTIANYITDDENDIFHKLISFFSYESHKEFLILCENLQQSYKSEPIKNFTRGWMKFGIEFLRNLKSESLSPEEKQLKYLSYFPYKARLDYIYFYVNGINIKNNINLYQKFIKNEENLMKKYNILSESNSSFKLKNIEVHIVINKYLSIPSQKVDKEFSIQGINLIIENLDNTSIVDDDDQLLELFSILEQFNQQYSANTSNSKDSITIDNIFETLSKCITNQELEDFLAYIQEILDTNPTLFYQQKWQPKFKKVLPQLIAIYINLNGLSNQENYEKYLKKTKLITNYSIEQKNTRNLKENELLINMISYKLSDDLGVYVLQGKINTLIIQNINKNALVKDNQKLFALFNEFTLYNCHNGKNKYNQDVFNLLLQCINNVELTELLTNFKVQYTTNFGDTYFKAIYLGLKIENVQANLEKQIQEQNSKQCNITNYEIYRAKSYQEAIHKVAQSNN
jgi:hypothetical protein